MLVPAKPVANGIRSTDLPCEQRDRHNPGVEIRRCRDDDVALLDRHMPSEVWRYGRQQDGLGTLLIAWRDGVPVGTCEVKWDGCSSPDVRARHPDCPEINGLSVWPESFRGQGIGTALVHAAEDLARSRRATHIGMGVGVDNARARSLYLRLGYEATVEYVDRWSYVDSAGATRPVADPCTFMTKNL